ncbi:MAG: ATPase core protein, partial [Campylobacterota bacterium]|nr:ATPase core protein [Campylobacterota bacterium]
KRICIVDVGSKENVIRMTSAHHFNPELGHAIGIPDGDASDVEIKNWCSKYMLQAGEICNDEEFALRKANYFTKLPSEIAPEKYILSKIQSDESFIRYIDNSDEFQDFILNQIDLSEDHHALFFNIAEFLSKDLDGVKRDILRYLSNNFVSEFESVVNLVNEKLA